MLSELEGLVGGREGVDVELFDRDIRRGQALAEGPEQNVIALEVCDRLLEALRQAVDTDRLALLVAQGEWVDRDRRRQLEPALDAVEAGRHHPAERDVGIGAGVGRLQLDIGRLRLMALEGRSDAQRAFAVVRTPGAVRRGPHLGLQPAVGVDRGAGERDQGREMLEDPRHELARQR